MLGAYEVERPVTKAVRNGGFYLGGSHQDQNRIYYLGDKDHVHHC
jgi:hypothetical protein